MDGNGAEETRVKFGTQEWQTMPVQMAELLLIEWRRTKPAEFGKVLAKVLTDDVVRGR